MKYVCSGCFEEKEKEEFHKNSRAKRGFAYSCKICENARCKTKHQKNLDENRLKQKLHARERLKKNPNYRKNLYEKRKKEILEYQKKLRHENPEKARARNKLNDFLGKGYVIRPEECSKCLNKFERIQAHHEDYSKPLEVTWVCIKCHRIIDEEKKKREDQEKYEFLKSIL